MKRKSRLKKDILSATLLLLILLLSLDLIRVKETPPIEDALIFVSDFDPVDASRLSNSAYRVGLDGVDMRYIAGSIRHPDLGFIRIAAIDCDSRSQLLAIASGRQDLDGFYVVGLDGAYLRQISDDGASLTGLAGIALAPDCKQVLVSRAFDEFSDGRYGLVLGDIEGNGFTAIKQPTALLSYVAPDWSPDGRRMAYIIKRIAPDSASEYAIAVAAADGSQERVILETRLAIEGIDWSPGGEWIVAALSKQIYRLRADGSDLAQLTNHHNGAHSPRWSPEGRQISFVASSTFPGQNQLMMMDADGTNVRRVANIRGTALNGCWV